MAEAWNIRLVGQMKEAGTSIVDVRDPSDPRFVGRIPVASNTHAHKVHVTDRFNGGLYILELTGGTTAARLRAR